MMTEKRPHAQTAAAAIIPLLDSRLLEISGASSTSIPVSDSLSAYVPRDIGWTISRAGLCRVTDEAISIRSRISRDIGGCTKSS